MITECQRNGDKLKIITNDNSEYVMQIKNLQDFLYDSNRIVARVENGKDSDIVVIDSDCKICFKLDSNINFRVSYLYTHPKYGICVVGSELINGKWEDGYYAYSAGAGFLRMSRSR